MKNKNIVKTVFIASVILLIFFSSFHPIFAQYTNQEKIPGAQPTSEFIPYLQSIINFGFAIIGILALFMLIIGAYQYLMAAGGGKAEGAKETISSALLGLVLGLCAWVILYKINPDLVNMRGITQITGGGAVGTPGIIPSGGGTLSPSDLSKVKCETVRNYSGFMNKSLSDGLYNENVKSVQDLQNALQNFRKGDTNGLTKYADTIYQACQDAKVPYWYAIGTFAKESNMFFEYKNGKDGEKYGCSYYNNPGCILDKTTGKPQQYKDEVTGIRENIANMGRRLSENPTPLGAWNAWYWPDRSEKNCAGAQEYLNFFSQAAKATGLSGI
ncbi:MAG: hypothetical protein NT093_03070 [Candidatus Moranbacteria bacterium]|nr:hypothetical protein [Candidatus Moranbacteria bacterium]